ncbi:MAG TPA: MFS transporter [Streptosporangiaceae bacterium]|nr:MFS transporter [Streptosporangiaceae bacterium]
MKSGAAGSSAAAHAKRGGRQPGPHYKWIALSNTTLGVLMATINQSIVHIALPDIFRGINVDPLAAGNTGYLLWMFMGFLVVSAVLVVSFGRLGDMFGRVRMYNLGFAVFTIASIFLAVTWMTGTDAALWLIVWRIVQGIGGAFLFANSTAILTDAFPANQRGTALGINSIAAISGSFLGLLLGGVLAPIEWRLVFLVSVPVGVFATFWAYFMLHDLNERHRAKMDWWGNVLFAVGLIAILIGITYGLEPYGGHPMGWTSPFVLSMIFGGLAVLIIFGLIETKVAEPMFRLSLFKIRAFAAGNLANLMMGLGRGGMQFTLIIWLQGIWLPLHGYGFSQTPLWAGIYLVPLTIGFLVSAPLSGYLSDRYGARGFTVGGALLTVGSFVCLMFLPVNFTYWVFALILALNGFGSGLFASPNRAEIMNSVPANQRGAAGGTIATFMNASFVLSIGIFFSLIVTGLSSQLPAALSHGLTSNGVPASAANTIAHLPPIGVLFAAFLGFNPIKQLLGSVLNHLSPAHASYLTGRDFFPTVITHPFHSGLGIAFWFAIAASIIAAIASLLTGRRRRKGAASAEPIGEELAAVAGDGGWEPSELVIPAVDLSGPASGPARLAAVQPASGSGAAGPDPASTGLTGSGLTGAVRDLSGHPVTAANITVTSARGRQVARTLTSPEGRYTVTGLPAAAITVIVTAAGHEPTAAALLAQPGSVLEKDFTLAGSGALSGVVRSAGPGGAPLAGAKVVISDPAGQVVASAVTSGDGAFTVDGAPAGSYALTATATGHLPASREIELNGHTETAQLTLPLEREVHGFVRAPGGAPMPGISVTAASTSGEIVASGITDADGWYRLTGLGDGEHVLVAGGHEPVSATVEVTSGETTSVSVRVGGMASPGPAAAPEPAATADGLHDVTSQLGTGHGE